MHEAETHIPILFNAGLSPRTPGDLVIAFFGYTLNGTIIG